VHRGGEDDDQRARDDRQELRGDRERDGLRGADARGGEDGGADAGLRRLACGTDRQRTGRRARAEVGERERQRHAEAERGEQGEADVVSNDPGDKRAEPARPAPRRAVSTTAIVARPEVTRHEKYGLVTTDLQPLDLTSAYTVSEWIVKSGLYPQFKTPSQVFVTIARGKELGLGMMTMLAGTHMIDGKPTLSADLIRALVARSPDYEYLYPVEMSAVRVTWVGKNKKHPEPVRYTYTIEEAQQAGLASTGSYGNKSNWSKRPQDMLMKTAGSKLARLLWPGESMGLYCPEEMGFTEDELQEAA